MKRFFIRAAVFSLILASPVVFAADKAPKQKAPQKVEIAVTEDGFVPSEIKVSKGQPVTLVVTRKTETTCAKEIVIADANVKKELPLNQPVTVTVTPSKTGKITYACGMDMVTGVLIVE